VGTHKGSAGVQHFAHRKAQLDVVRGQTDFVAEYPNGLVHEVTRPREKPQSLKEIQELAVKLSHLIWPQAGNEVPGQLLDFCEEKGLPLPFRIAEATNDSPFGKTEAKLKRRFRETRYRYAMAQCGRGLSQDSVWMWYRRFLQSRQQTPLAEVYFCYPQCNGSMGSDQPDTTSQTVFAFPACARCGRPATPREAGRFCRMPANFTLEDARLIQALCSEEARYSV
jgi:hypothetical protein